MVHDMIDITYYNFELVIKLVISNNQEEENQIKVDKKKKEAEKKRKDLYYNDRCIECRGIEKSMTTCYINTYETRYSFY